MKAAKLAEKLLEYPDFDVTTSFQDEVLDKISGSTWPTYRHFSVEGILDIGHSSKVIKLDIEETD